MTTEGLKGKRNVGVDFTTRKCRDRGKYSQSGQEIPGRVIFGDGEGLGYGTPDIIVSSGSRFGEIPSVIGINCPLLLLRLSGLHNKSHTVYSVLNVCLWVLRPLGPTEGQTRLEARRNQEKRHEDLP